MPLIICMAHSAVRHAHVLLTGCEAYTQIDEEAMRRSFRGYQKPCKFTYICTNPCLSAVKRSTCSKLFCQLLWMWLWIYTEVCGFTRILAVSSGVHSDAQSQIHACHSPCACITALLINNDCKTITSARLYIILKCQSYQLGQQIMSVWFCHLSTDR